MLGAVHSIHEAKIIHGDLKPANFLFVKGALKLIDFGIARAIQSDDTTNIYRENQVGTLNYMSPEAILDSGAGGASGPKMRLGRASDVWSLGCILYQMCIGVTPFAKVSGGVSRGDELRSRILGISTSSTDTLIRNFSAANSDAVSNAVSTTYNAIRYARHSFT